jgi:hypothetical protein
VDHTRFGGFNLEKAREFLRNKKKHKQALIDRRFQKARNDFERITAMIWKTYKPRAIYQWGSLLNLDRFSGISDIDIALTGDIPAEAFFEMYGKAMEMTDLPLDIIELDKIHPLHAMSIRERGRMVYGSE